jgi:hypothetical protein
VVENAIPVLVKVWLPLAKRMSFPEEIERVLFFAIAVVAKEAGGWVSASINAPTAAATRDVDLRLLLISLSFHQSLHLLLAICCDCAALCDCELPSESSCESLNCIYWEDAINCVLTSSRKRDRDLQAVESTSKNCGEGDGLRT